MLKDAVSFPRYWIKKMGSGGKEGGRERREKEGGGAKSPGISATSSPNWALRTRAGA